MSGSSSFLLWNPSCRGREALLPTLLLLGGESQGLGMQLRFCGGSDWWSWDLLEPLELLAGPSTESSPERGQQSLDLGTFPGPHQPLPPAWPEVFDGVSQATANLGESSVISSGEGGNPRQPRCHGCHRPSSMQHHVKQLCKQMCHSWKAKWFPQV